MKLSIFTPTHDPKFLLELWQTLKEQPGDWEWIILYNNGATKPMGLDNPRIRHVTHPDPGESRIGALKKFACDQARGDILVEVDHDDLLAPDALEKVAEAFTDPEVGFVYSDFAEFYDGTWKPQVYGASSGWQTYPLRFQEHPMTAHKAFSPDARSICQIEFAPNHVRAWRRSIYEKLGGHRTNLAAGDDHELVCRTYLTTRMRHIPECLYFYRRQEDSSNSYVKRYQTIRRQDTINRNDYLYRLVERWCQLSALPRVDLGSLTGKPEGWIGLDMRAGADIVHDVTKGLPFQTSSVGAVRAADFLEHIQDPVPLMNEIHRVLVPGGWLLSMTPSTEGKGAFCDPTHKSFWNDLSFRYYCDANFAKYVDGIGCRFQAVRVVNYFPSPWHEQNSVPYVCGDLVAIKEGYRPPGELRI